MSEFIQYSHHGVTVWVRADLQGQHRDHCLCYHCNLFKPNQPDNCPIAQENYAFCVRNNLTTPVYECPQFQEAVCETMTP